MSGLIRNIVLALGLALIAWLGYSVFIKDTSELITTSDDRVTALRHDAQVLLVNLRQLQSIDLSGKIFTDARFQSLVDMRQEVVDEPIGRINPFIPTTGKKETE